MKCLSIQQPWASLICGGIKDVENRSWRVNDAPGCILIHAGKSMRYNPEENPLFFEILMSNATTCGYIPELADMPMGAIIGYADIVGFTEECTSDWAQEGPGTEWKWQIENAKLFKKPIPYSGRKGLFGVSGREFLEIKSEIAALQKGELIIKDTTLAALGISGKTYKKIKTTHLI